jgi:hypothetical protein
MHRSVCVLNKLFYIAGSIFILTLISCLASAYIGCLCSIVICACLLGLNLLAGSGIVVCDLQRSFITIALVIGSLTTLCCIGLWRDFLREDFATLRNYKNSFAKSS